MKRKYMEDRRNFTSRKKWLEHAARVQNMRNVCTVLSRILKGKDHLVDLGVDVR
jgi:hypothetical protein